MRVHFIAIGGAAMHNLAIALHNKGYKVSGSDDEIFDPSRSRLAEKGLLPEKFGWFPEKINNNIDAVILGMHAREDNPELLKAKESGIAIYSFPEYLYEQSKNKTRVVIGGSHGKTTITAMILHVLKQTGIDCDFMVGAMLEGFDVMVKITEQAKIIILEGDEYLTSPIDKRPKFHVYKPDIALISGIAWDHFNVFKTFDNYVWQFEEFTRLITENGKLIYYSGDEIVERVAKDSPEHITKIPYTVPDHIIDDGISKLSLSGESYPIMVFGEHNLANLAGAWKVCGLLGVKDIDFINSISTYKGASNRLETLHKSEELIVFRDFAHSPSKLKASVEAVRKQYPSRKLLACMELHTYSSLNAEFLGQYKACANSADIAMVYYNPHTLKLKKLPLIDETQVRTAFKRDDILVFDDSEKLKQSIIENIGGGKTNLLMMSSGNFNNLNINSIIDSYK